MNAAEPPPLEDVPEPTSVGAKLFNVIATPGDVYEELRQSKPRVANWLIPLLLLMVSNSVFTWVSFRDPAVVHDIQEQQAQQIRKSMAGRPKVTEEKIEKAVEGTRKFMSPNVLAVFGMIGASVAVAVFLFAQGFVFWVVDRFVLRTGTDFMRFVEIGGVAESISVLSAVARMFLVQGTGKIQLGASLALLVDKFDPANPVHLLLNNVEFFFLWYLAVVALGISIVTRASLAKSLFATALVWICLTALMILPTLASR